MTNVTDADRERKKRIQQRFLTDGISHSQVLEEELSHHREEATRELVEALKTAASCLQQCASGEATQNDMNTWAEDALEALAKHTGRE